MDHRRTPRCLSGVRFGLPRWRLRRRPARGSRSAMTAGSVSSAPIRQQLLAGADRRVAADLRLEPRPGVADGPLPGRARREVCARHRHGLGQGRKTFFGYTPWGGGGRLDFDLSHLLPWAAASTTSTSNRLRRHRAIDRGAVLTGRHAGARARPVQVRQQHGARGSTGGAGWATRDPAVCTRSSSTISARTTTTMLMPSLEAEVCR